MLAFTREIMKEEIFKIIGKRLDENLSFVNNLKIDVTDAFIIFDDICILLNLSKEFHRKIDDYFLIRYPGCEAKFRNQNFTLKDILDYIQKILFEEEC